MKYKVSFVQGESEVILADELNDIQACQYAVNLHQSSNIAHEVRVSSYGATQSIVLLSLIKK